MQDSTYKKSGTLRKDEQDMLKGYKKYIASCSKCGKEFDPSRDLPLSCLDSFRCRFCGNEHKSLEVLEECLQSDDISSKSSPKKKIYLIESKNAAKIGVSHRPKQRLRSLQTGNENSLELIKTWETERAEEIEAKVHNTILDKSKNGE